MSENSQTQKAPSGFPVWDSGLVPGHDCNFHGRRICLTHAAAEKLAATLKVAPDARNGLHEPCKHVAEVIFKVHPRKCSNPHILLCSDGNGGPVRVHFKTKDKLRPGMEVRCTKLRDGLYQLVGNHPRFTGKYL